MALAQSELAGTAGTAGAVYAVRDVLENGTGPILKSGRSRRRALVATDYAGLHVHLR